MTQEKFTQQLEEAKRLFSIKQVPGQLQEEFNTIESEYEILSETLSSSDWARFGVITGMLWYKLDAIISELKSLNKKS